MTVIQVARKYMQLAKGYNMQDVFNTEVTFSFNGRKQI